MTETKVDYLMHGWPADLPVVTLGPWHVRAFADPALKPGPDEGPGAIVWQVNYPSVLQSAATLPAEAAERLRAIEAQLNRAWCDPERVLLASLAGLDDPSGDARPMERGLQKLAACFTKGAKIETSIRGVRVAQTQLQEGEICTVYGSRSQEDHTALHRGTVRDVLQARRIGLRLILGGIQFASHAVRVRSAPASRSWSIAWQFIRQINGGA